MPNTIGYAPILLWAYLEAEVPRSVEISLGKSFRFRDLPADLTLTLPEKMRDELEARMEFHLRSQAAEIARDERKLFALDIAALSGIFDLLRVRTRNALVRRLSFLKSIDFGSARLESLSDLMAIPNFGITSLVDFARTFERVNIEALKHTPAAIRLASLNFRAESVPQPRLVKNPIKRGPKFDAEKIRRAVQLYKDLGTLEGAGKKMGLSRERVRQLIAKGRQVGIVVDNEFDKPLVSADAILAEFETEGNWAKVRSKFRLSPESMLEILLASGRSPDKVAALAQARRLRRCKAEYDQLVAEVGYHPSSFLLQKKYRNLSSRIHRYWGSITAFRERFGINPPKPGNPNIRRDVGNALERHRELLRMRKNDRLERLLVILSESHPKSINDLSVDLRLSQHQTYNLLAILKKRGQVRMLGGAHRVVYTIETSS